VSMAGSLSRPFGIVLLAVLAAAPVVRTLCAWECAAPAASEAAAPAAEHAGHCAQPAGSAGSETAGLVSLGGCERCDAGDVTLRATVRTQTPSPIILLASPFPATLDEDPRASDFVSAAARATSPPLRAPYPLRI
jgi:hypothetical protein